MDDLPDDIFNIDATDPLTAVMEIERRLRPGGFNDPEVVFRYYEIVKRACSVFGVDFDLTADEPDNPIDARKLLYLTKLQIDKIRIDLLGEKLQFGQSITLDKNWRDKIHSRLAVIRKIVEGAGLSPELHELVLNKWHALDAAIDQTRTPMQKFSDVLVSLCEGVSAGAEALKPAVEIIERIVGAVARLRSKEPTLALPPPETYGLKAEDPPALPPPGLTEA